MYLSDKLINFLMVSSRLSNSTILLTDLEKVLFIAAEELPDKYVDKTLSSSLKKIISLYESEHTAINYMNTTMDSIVPLIEHDIISSYSSQIILPIVHDELEGLLIFFASDRKYLFSNLKFAKTTKHFVELFSKED